MNIRREDRNITGLVNLYKPPNITSFKAVDTIKKSLRARKAGHCGTLDPMAEGVLLICFGKAVRFADILGTLEKKYQGVLKLGEATDTQDSEGTVINEGSFDHLTENEVEKTFYDFEGVIEQCPPMYSAVKYKGKPLYTYARNGIEIDRESREVFIKSISIDDISLPYVYFRVTCSRGTFIRTLCDDIGRKLGCYGHLNNLKRTAIGDFRVQDSVTIEELRESCDNEYTDDLIMPIENGLYFLDTVEIDEENKYKILNGQQVQISLLDQDISPKSNCGVIKVIDSDGKFICVAAMMDSRKEDYCFLQPKIVIYSDNMVKSTT